MIWDEFFFFNLVLNPSEVLNGLFSISEDSIMVRILGLANLVNGYTFDSFANLNTVEGYIDRKKIVPLEFWVYWVKIETIG